MLPARDGVSVCVCLWECGGLCVSVSENHILITVAMILMHSNTSIHLAQH